MFIYSENLSSIAIAITISSLIAFVCSHGAFFVFFFTHHGLLLSGPKETKANFGNEAQRKLLYA